MGIGEIMARMDKYEENNEKSFSRTRKNEDLYKDVYLNNTLIDLNKIMSDETEIEEEVIEKEVVEFKEVHYEEKSYDLSEFLKEKRDNKVSDNLPRSLDEKIKEDEDEISKLISIIEQKEKESDFFADLLPDDENTIITDSVVEEKLDNFISDDAINNFVMHKDLDETNSFMDLDETKLIKTTKKNKVKIKKLPIIVFGITTILLIAVIIYIIVK